MWYGPSWRCFLCGIDTPSLTAQGEQRRSSFFNIDRDIPVAWVASVSHAPFAWADNSEALKLIVETANQLCQEVPLEQTRSGKTLNAESKAKIGGTVGKLIDMGFAGAGNYTEESSKGILQKDLTAAIQDGNNCKIRVLEILKEKLLTELEPSKKLETQDKLNITNYDVPNAELFCTKLKQVVSSAKRKFRGDLSKSEVPLGNGYRHKVVMPNAYYCAMNWLPGYSGQMMSYYSCSLFHDEQATDNAYSKFASYHSLIEKCLGTQWSLSLQQRVKNKGAEASFNKDGDDPRIELRTRERKDGIDMNIYVQPPGL